MRTIVIIPALNEEQSIAMVLRAIPRHMVADVVVVDNGSTDQTADRARAEGATVLLEERRGYGYACLTGIDWARRHGADILAFLDGDYSDYPEEIGRIVEPILRDEADFVIGSRVRGNSQPGALLPQAILGNKLACALMRLFWNAHFTDLGPFRAIRLRDLDRLELREGTYGWTIEMQIKAVQHGLRYIEVPVSYRKRIGTSKVTGTLSGTYQASVKILATIYRLARGKR